MLVQSLPPLAAGGAEMHAIALGKKLTEKGISVFFITPGVGKIKGEKLVHGMPVFYLHSWFNYLLDFLFAIKKKSRNNNIKIEYDDATEKTNEIIAHIGIGARLRYLFFLMNASSFFSKKKNEIDIIHVHTIEWPAYIGALLNRKFKKKLVVKDSTMNGIFNILRYPSGRHKQQLIIEEAHFVAMTRVIHTNFLAAGIHDEKISMIPNGIEINNVVKDNSDPFLKKVIFVGNLYQQPGKGVDILLKAWKQVQQQYPDAVLQLVGDGNLSAYEVYAKKNGIDVSVKFLGKRNDVHELLLQSDVFVLPSRREGMPNALMEAMLKGMPCVATNISGCQDLISNSINGLLVPPANVDQLAHAIIYLLGHPNEARAMGQQARKTVCEKLDMDMVADQYIKLYKHLLDINQNER